MVKVVNWISGDCGCIHIMFSLKKIDEPLRSLLVQTLSDQAVDHFNNYFKDQEPGPDAIGEWIFGQEQEARVGFRK